VALQRRRRDRRRAGRRMDQRIRKQKSHARVPSGETRGPFTSVVVGAGSSAALFVLLGLVTFLSGVIPFGEEAFSNYFLVPAIVGGIAGAAVGCAVWSVLTKRRVSAVRIVFSWCLLGGVAGIVLAVGASAVLLASGVNFLGGSTAQASLPFLLGMLALPIIGSIAGTIVGVMKVRTRQGPGRTHREEPPPTIVE
jgi:hypothetical protein